MILLPPQNQLTCASAFLHSVLKSTRLFFSSWRGRGGELERGSEGRCGEGAVECLKGIKGNTRTCVLIQSYSEEAIAVSEEGSGRLCSNVSWDGNLGEWGMRREGEMRGGKMRMEEEMKRG